MSSRHTEGSQSAIEVNPGDTTPISDTGKQDQSGQVAQTNQMIQSGQVEQGSTSAQGQGQPQQQSTSTNIQKQKELDLDPEILQAIGERVHPDRKLAPAIHIKFATGIEEVIKKGLPADKRKVLIKKFPLPENCLMMDPPKLNPELKLAFKRL